MKLIRRVKKWMHWRGIGVKDILYVSVVMGFLIFIASAGVVALFL